MPSRGLSTGIIRRRVPHIDKIATVSEFVFGTHNAAFVQVMYEQYLRDPASVGEEWRNLFDNGRLSELPVIPTDRAEVLGRGEKGEVLPAAPPRTSPISPLPSGLTPLTGRQPLRRKT